MAKVQESWRGHAWAFAFVVLAAGLVLLVYRLFDPIFAIIAAFALGYSMGFWERRQW
jgi:CHASE2 domain-containing sensor protein